MFRDELHEKIKTIDSIGESNEVVEEAIVFEQCQ